MKFISFLFVVFISNSVLGQWGNFEEGFYIGVDGSKREGYLEYVSGQEVKFNPSLEGKKIKLTPDDIASFVLGNHEFTVISNFKSERKSVFRKRELKKVFASVVLSGSINLYRYQRMANNAAVTNSGVAFDIGGYYFIQQGDGQAVHVPEKKKGFRVFMCSLLKNDPELVDQVKHKELGFDDLVEIIKRYNRK